MPFLGAGVDNHVNVTPTPVLVFTPNPSAAAATARFFNEGSTTVYVGGANVSQFNGIPLMPNQKVELSNVNGPLFACGGYSAGANNTTMSGASAAGATSFTVASSTGISAGVTLIVGNGTGREFVNVTAGTGTVTTSALLYDHATGCTVSTATPVIGLLRVAGSTTGAV